MIHKKQSLRRLLRFRFLALATIAVCAAGCNINDNETGKNIEVEGWVINASDKIAVQGADIVVKGMQRGTSTDRDGHFKITVPDTAVLVVSNKGFDTMTRPLEGVPTQMISLKENSSEKQ